ncbi:MAG TPA: hypothetical protein VJH95_06245 [Candidatus Nanoarchaeia archaeon]|nr:hypothetical protein [Candidatus Nanoarchaeia archaeon]
MEKKGQVATEYLVIIGFILVILVPITIIYFKYTGSTYDIVGGSKTGQIANEIVKAANEVYAFGEGSQKKIKMGFPDGIDNVGFEKREIVFRFKDSKGRFSEIVEVADTDFAATTIPITPGQKEIIVRSLGNRVAVTIACNSGETKPGDAMICNALCNPPKSSCSLTCSNRAWTAINCV